MDKFVIVVGNNHDNTLNVIRALGIGGYKVILYLISSKKKNYISKSKYIHESILFEDANGAINHLIERTNDSPLPLITTADAITAEIDKYYVALSSKYILPTCGGHDGGIIEYMDKVKMCKVAESVGMVVPKSISLKRNDSLHEIIHRLNFPVLVKPQQSILGSKNDFRIWHSIAQANKEYGYELREIDSLVIQDFIPNDEVILIGGIRTPDGINHMVGHINKVKHGNNNNNLGMNSLGIFSNNPILHNECSDFVKKIDYFGPYSFEFIRHNNKLYFIEINLRTDGLYFFYTSAGFNIPSIWADYCYKISRDYQVKSRIIGMCEFQYIKNYLRPNSLLTNIKDFFNTDSYSIFSRHDFLPFIYKFIYHNN